SKIIKIVSILFFRHLGFLLLSKYEHKNLSHYKTDQSASRKCKDPGKHHIFYHSEVNGRQSLHCSHTHDRARLRVSRGDRYSEQTGIQKTESSRQVRREALIAFQLDHIHSNGFDDLLSAHAGSKPHHDTAQKHQPQRDLHPRDRALAIRESDSQEQDTDKLLTVLSSVHKTHRCSSRDLRPCEETVRLSPVHLPAEDRDELTDDPSGDKSEQKAQHQAVDDFHPFAPVDAADSVLDRDRRSGQAGDQAVAFTRGNSEHRCRNTVDNDRDKSRAQCDQRTVSAVSEIYHVTDRRCN